MSPKRKPPMRDLAEAEVDNNLLIHENRLILESLFEQVKRKFNLLHTILHEARECSDVGLVLLRTQISIS
jgi:hypothetical protein